MKCEKYDVAKIIGTYFMQLRICEVLSMHNTPKEICLMRLKSKL